MNIDNYEDVIDSRDVIARIAELEEIASSAGDTYEFNDGLTAVETGLDEDEAEELHALTVLAGEGQQCSEDWDYGATLIRDSYFEDYAQQLAEDIGAINSDAGWPNNCIDWERAARELQMDYTSVDFDGVTYWTR